MDTNVCLEEHYGGGGVFYQIIICLHYHQICPLLYMIDFLLTVACTLVHVYARTHAGIMHTHIPIA